MEEGRGGRERQRERDRGRESEEDGGIEMDRKDIIVRVEGGKEKEKEGEREVY